MKRKVIVCDPDSCNGCRICMYVCASFKEPEVNPRHSRIRVQRIDPVFDVALSCRRCENPSCIGSCPNQAITQDRYGVIHIDEDECDGCGECVEACSFGVIGLHMEKTKALVCDFCRDEPRKRCVEYCPKEALSYRAVEDITDEKTRGIQQQLQELGDIEEEVSV